MKRWGLNATKWLFSNILWDAIKPYLTRLMAAAAAAFSFFFAAIKRAIPSLSVSRALESSALLTIAATIVGLVLARIAIAESVGYSQERMDKAIDLVFRGSSLLGYPHAGIDKDLREWAHKVKEWDDMVLSTLTTKHAIAKYSDTSNMLPFTYDKLPAGEYTQLRRSLEKRLQNLAEMLSSPSVFFRPSKPQKSEDRQ